MSHFDALGKTPAGNTDPHRGPSCTLPDHGRDHTPDVATGAKRSPDAHATDGSATDPHHEKRVRAESSAQPVAPASTTLQGHGVAGDTFCTGGRQAPAGSVCQGTPWAPALSVPGQATLVDTRAAATLTGWQPPAVPTDASCWPSTLHGVPAADSEPLASVEMGPLATSVRNDPDLVALVRRFAKMAKTSQILGDVTDDTLRFIALEMAQKNNFDQGRIDLLVSGFQLVRDRMRIVRDGKRVEAGFAPSIEQEGVPVDPAGVALIAQLRARNSALEARVKELEAEASQVPALRAKVEDLRAHRNVLHDVVTGSICRTKDTLRALEAVVSTSTRKVAVAGVGASASDRRAVAADHHQHSASGAGAAVDVDGVMNAFWGTDPANWDFDALGMQMDDSSHPAPRA